jgi:hypothetical protein
MKLSASMASESERKSQTPSPWRPVMAGRPGAFGFIPRRFCRSQPPYATSSEAAQTCPSEAEANREAAAFDGTSDRGVLADLASLRSRLWDLLANDQAAICPDASFDDAISARQ